MIRQPITVVLRQRMASLRSHWAWWLAAAGLCVVAIWLLRGPIADRLWPEARAEALRRQGETALAQGHLSSADGHGARELFEAALAIDSDRAEIRYGLARVAQAAVLQARAAVGRGAFDEARQQLRLAQSLSAPRAQIEAVNEILRRREAAMAGIDDWLTSADKALAENRLDGGEDAALPLYRRVLELQPERIEALEGREDALSALLQQARQDLQRNAVVEAGSKIAAAMRYDAGHAELPALQSQLIAIGERARKRGDAELDAGRLQRAAEHYRAWRASGVDAAEAESVFAAVAAAHLIRAREALKQGEIARAKDEVTAARALSPAFPDIALVQRDLDHARTSTVGSGSKVAMQARGEKALSREQQRRLRALLREMDAALARGDWLTPPGRSAYDRMQAARAIAPRHPDVVRARAGLLPRAKACFTRELRNNRLRSAQVCLDAHVALGDTSVAIARARRELSARWLAVGEERLARGELVSAQAALQASRTVDRTTPGQNAFAKRLRAAMAGTGTGGGD